MREAGWYAKRTRRRALPTRRDPSHPVAPHLFHREWTAEKPKSTWVTAIPSIPTSQGWLDLAVILDLSSRMVGGWSMSRNGDENLRDPALAQAIARRRRHPQGCCITAREGVTTRHRRIGPVESKLEAASVGRVKGSVGRMLPWSHSLVHERMKVEGAPSPHLTMKHDGNFFLHGSVCPSCSSAFHARLRQSVQ